MRPYRSAPEVTEDEHRPWPLPALVAAAVIAWWFVAHAIGSIAGRF